MSRKRAAGDLRDGEAARPRTISEIMMDSTAGEPVSAGSLAELEREPVAVEEVAVAEKAVARREGVSVRVVDGRIVIDEASLQFDEAAEEAIGNSRQVLQETRFSKRRAKERKKATWNSRDTERFYLVSGEIYELASEYLYFG